MAFVEIELISEQQISSKLRLHCVGRLFIMCSFSADLQPRFCPMCTLESTISRIKETVYDALEMGKKKICPVYIELLSHNIFILQCISC